MVVWQGSSAVMMASCGLVSVWQGITRLCTANSLIDMDKSLLGKNPFEWLGSFFSNMAKGLKRIFEWVAQAVVAAVKFIVRLWHLISFFFDFVGVESSHT